MKHKSNHSTVSSHRNQLSRVNIFSKYLEKFPGERVYESHSFVVLKDVRVKLNDAFYKLLKWNIALQVEVLFYELHSLIVYPGIILY